MRGAEEDRENVDHRIPWVRDSESGVFHSTAFALSSLISLSSSSTMSNGRVADSFCDHLGVHRSCIRYRWVQCIARPLKSTRTREWLILPNCKDNLKLKYGEIYTFCLTLILHCSYGGRFFLLLITWRIFQLKILMSYIHRPWQAGGSIYVCKCLIEYSETLHREL